MRNHVYRGRRLPDNSCVVEVRQGAYWHPLPPRLDLWNHSPDGFEWGYLGSGPAQLALALLAHVTHCGHLACLLHQKFKADVVLKFGKDRWELRSHEIAQWMFDQCEHDFACPEQYTLTGRTPGA